MADSTTQHKCFHVFYTKDIKKKKKMFMQGVLLVMPNTAKLFDEDGRLVTSFKNKEEVVIDEEYTINNSYSVTIEKEGNMNEFNTGAIFTKKQMTVLPIKKKAFVGVNSKSGKQQDLVELKGGLSVQKRLHQILRPHQKQGVEFMYGCVSGKKSNALTGCILADYMGLGKTLQTLALCYSMIKQKEIKKFVIVCPLTLLDVWQKQAKKWLLQKITPLVCYGDGSETTNIVKKFTANQYRMLIISYETFYRNIQKISGKCDMIIFDQGHRMKNKKSKLLLKLKAFKCEKRILLTGTPIQNNLEELYTCISIINPRMFGNQVLFKNVFMRPILEGLGKKATGAQKQLAKQRTAELARQLKEFSLRRTAEVLKKFLPPRYQHLIFLKLTPLQSLWYKRIVTSKSQKDEDMFKTLNYLRKLFIHPSILKTSKIDHGDCHFCSEDCSDELSYKIEFTLNIIADCIQKEEKCVVVSYYTETLDFIGGLLKAKGISYAKLDGRQKPSERRLSIMKFQKQIPVLLLSGKAGGTGLTLICAVKMVMIEPDWNPSNDSQVMGRIWRQGQTKQVHIYRLITASTFQQKILQRQSLKKTLSNNLIDNGQEYENAVDYQSIGKLFVENKCQVLTYRENQNEIENFMKNHSRLRQIKDSGVLFVKTNWSAEPKEVENEQVNEFNDLQLLNFMEKEKDAAADSQQEFEVDNQEDFNQIQQMEKINLKPKKLTSAQKSQQVSKSETEDSQPCQKQSQIKQVNKQLIMQQSTLMVKVSGKKETMAIGPSNLLKKILKIQK